MRDLATLALIVVGTACDGDRADDAARRAAGHRTSAARGEVSRARQAERAAPPGYVRLSPSGCEPILVQFTPPAGLEAGRGDDETMARWITLTPSSDPLAIQERRAWFDFITVRVRCAVHLDEARRWARESKDLYASTKTEQPFRTAGDPRVQRMRQTLEIFTDETDAVAPVLEFRRRYPDGTPGGFVYDRYEGRCWSAYERARVVVELGVNAPLVREAEARARFRGLCLGLKTADVRGPA